MTSLDTLLDALRSDDPRLRQQAAMELGAQDATPVMPALVAAMAAETDDFVRETLIWAVVARPDAATPELVKALDRDLPREPILHALSKIGDPATVPAILPHAADPDPTVAAKAWWALGRIGDGIPTLVTHLGAADAERRLGLTRALLQAGAPAIDALAGALTSDDAAVRSHAAEILVAFADPARAGTAERRAGQNLSARAADALLRSAAAEVDGALLLAGLDEDHPALADLAQRLRDERD